MSDQPEINQPPNSQTPEQGYGIFDLLWIAVKDIPVIMRTLKFGVWVILILALFTLLGTILPQEKFARDDAAFAEQYVNIFHLDPDDNRTGFGEILHYGIVVPLELYRVFDTSLYLVLMALLAISSALCAYDRLRITRKLLVLAKARTHPRQIEGFPYSGEGTVTVGIGVAADRARGFLAGKGFHVLDDTDETGTIWLFGRKNTFKHYASIAFHFAFVLILVGGIIGHDTVLGYDGQLSFSEGQTRLLGSEIQKMREAEVRGETYTPDMSAYMVLDEYENVYRESDFGGIDPDTGFPLDYRGQPSDYVSHIKVLEMLSEDTETVAAERAILVNRPFRFRGVAYFQLAVDARLEFTVLNPGGNSFTVETFLNQPFHLQGYDRDLHCIVKAQDFAGGVWEAIDGSRTELPFAVRLWDFSDYLAGASDEFVLLGYVSEDISVSAAGSTILLTGIEEYTVLQYVRDPGIPIVYFGGLILIIGLTLTLYFPFRQVRVMLKPEGDGTAFLAGGNVEEFPEHLSKALQSGKVS